MVVENTNLDLAHTHRMLTPFYRIHFADTTITINIVIAKYFIPANAVIHFYHNHFYVGLKD